MNSALLVWHEHVDGEARRAIRVLRNHLLLGRPASQATAELGGPLAPDAPALSAFVGVHARSGGDAARMVTGLAEAAERRLEATARSLAHGSGAKLSARLVAGLPLAFVPMAPLTDAPLADPAGILLLVCGAGLAVAGIAWVSALFPRPEIHDDAAAVVADVLACGLEAGGDPGSTLRDLCSCPPPGVDAAVVRVRRLLDLGARWHLALAMSGHPDLRALGLTMKTAVRLGLPLVEVLRESADRIRRERERRFEEAIRRAPVRMAVPLAVCVLPSFVVLGIGPFLRGLSFTA